MNKPPLPARRPSFASAEFAQKNRVTRRQKFLDEMERLLHGRKTRAFVDAGYTGVHKHAEILKAQAVSKLRSDFEWLVAEQCSKTAKMVEGPLKEITQALERAQAQISARVV